jgi:hypothetical protein
MRNAKTGQTRDSDCAHGARDEQNDYRERNKNLDHREDLGPARKQRRVGRSECRTLREGDEQIIDEARPPARTGKLSAFVMRDLHLRKNKAAAAEFAPYRWAAAVKTPIPKREHDHVCQPE